MPVSRVRRPREQPNLVNGEMPNQTPQQTGRRSPGRSGASGGGRRVRRSGPAGRAPRPGQSRRPAAVFFTISSCGRRRVWY